MRSAKAADVGNPVFIIGSFTGKDGIAGAASASKNLTETTMDGIPSVQVGDPFQEKLLLEATLELVETGRRIRDARHGRCGHYLPYLCNERCRRCGYENIFKSSAFAANQYAALGNTTL